MTRTAVARLASLTAITVAMAIGINVALRDAGPFNQRFVGCEPASAYWKLSVQYKIRGRSSDRSFEAYYRRQDNPFTLREPGWLTGPSVDSYEMEVLWGNFLSMHICGCGKGGGSSESIEIWPTETASGVDLEIKHEYREGNVESKLTEQLRLPFRRNARGVQGDIAYDASWQRVLKGIEQ